MSATINTNDANFIVFGSGHNYTRINSGDGRKNFFSHKKVPKGSWLYANQFLFYVPDEDGNRIDAVRYDREHCTFSPALGTAFNTVGEQTVSVHYWREYIHDEETILVERQLSTTVEVVDHGNVVASAPPYFIYEDGYCFFMTPINDASQFYLHNDNNYLFDKVSNIPFRAYDLKEFCQYSACKDISELVDADTSQVQTIERAFSGCDLTDLSPLAEWDLSSTNRWLNSGKFISVFEGNYHLEDLTPLARWDMSYARDISSMFQACCSLTDLTPLANWDVSNVTKMEYTFFMSDGNPDGVSLIKSLDGLENWDVSKVTSFRGMFNNLFWLEDISALAEWDVSNGTDFIGMFEHCNVPDLDDIVFDLSSVTNATYLKNMFSTSYIFHSSALGKDVLHCYSDHNVDDEGQIYTDAEVGTVTSISHDASNASNWNVSVTGANAFTAYSASINSGWINIPSWN